MNGAQLASAWLSDFETQLVNASLNEGPIEDILDGPRLTLTRVIKLVNGIVLVNDAAGITHIGEIQTTLEGMLHAIDGVLPRQAREMTIAQARPRLAPLVAEVPQLQEWLRQLAPFISPFGDLWK
ncbi:hypothetical protein VSR69_42545 [Paraburkholderia phytofirmans]|uniref:hypothetical protein n=1 Tax=Paraburkholderia sp. BL9I2N2 TaxID=1938809 RepID=UPI00104E6719|nr:hypothetical protein [Paraburkholderia sp. BL9I2N2]TCK94135.1 hypothetical protein B0G74_0671 [Paraburkholderia sp. BL9I2N2]